MSLSRRRSRISASLLLLASLAWWLLEMAAAELWSQDAWHWQQKWDLCIEMSYWNISDNYQEGGGIDLIFHTNTESGKTSDIDSDPHINVSFLNASGEWASISGTSSIITDRDVIKKYYSPSLKAWLGDLGDGKHDGGPEDPRIGIIKVETKTATYALVRKSAISRGVEIAQGLVTGKAASVNRLREISEQEVATWRSSNKMVE